MIKDGGGRMKQIWWKSLRIKIITWSFIPTAIILSAVAWFTFYSYQKVIGDQAIKLNQEIVQEKAKQAITALNNKISPIILQVFLEIDNRHDEPIEVRAENILNQADNLEYFDGGIYFLDQNGKVFKTQPGQPDLIGQDWSDTPQFRFLQKQNNASMATDLHTIESSGKKIVCSAIAMIGQKGETVGAVYFCFKVFPVTPNTYYQVFNSVNLGPNFYLLDGNQRIIYSENPAEIAKDLSQDPILRQLFSTGNLSGRFRSGREDIVTSYFVLFPLLGTESWIALTKESWVEVMRPSLPYRQLLLLLLALGVIVPVIVTTIGVRHITNPIQKLIQAAAKVTAGHFKHRIVVNTADEIETLADQFNLMSDKLADSYASLEKKVADRTRELAIMNAIISVTSHSLDIHQILKEALNKTVEQLHFDAGVAYELETDPIKATLIASRGFKPGIATDLAGNYTIKDHSKSINHPHKVNFYPIGELKDEKQGKLMAKSGIDLLVQIPLSTKGRTLGFILLGKKGPGRLSPEEQSLLNSIGQQIGVAMENAHLYEQAEKTAVTAERNRLARELHDAVTQTLFSANLIADVIPRVWKRNPKEGLQSLEELRQLTRGALAEMRTMLIEMRPESLERSDIKSLLTQLTDAFIGRVRVPVSLVIQGECGLTQDAKIVFYRVAQEALNNIAKHSGARNVELHLKCQPGHFNMIIKDDGLGFKSSSIPAGHMGIAIMRERANSIGARFTIESQEGMGTTINLEWIPARRD
jgi:nitrate/nitrite-specific signal transduction histidine kinase